MSVDEILAPVIAAALADSVNPCTFSVFTALMLMIMFFKGRARMLQAGGAFIAAVYLMYYLMGLGLIRVFAELWWLVYVVAAAGIALGSYELYTSLAEGKFKSPLPRPLYRFTERMVDAVSRKGAIPLCFGLGVLVSLTLLPCSSGPYLIALCLMSKLPFCEVCGLLCLYNLIFVAPLIGILAAVTAAESYVKKVKRFRAQGLRWMNIVASILLIAVCVYVLFAW